MRQVYYEDGVAAHLSCQASTLSGMYHRVIALCAVAGWYPVQIKATQTLAKVATKVSKPGAAEKVRLIGK